MPGIQNFRCARIILGGIETMRVIRKRQMVTLNGSSPSATGQLYSLVT